MKIRTRMLAATGLGIILGAAVVFILLGAIRELSAARRERTVADRITTGFYDLTLLARDYLHNRAPRARIQWEAAGGKISEDLSLIYPSTARERELKTELVRGLERLRRLFSSISEHQAAAGGDDEDRESRLLNAHLSSEIFLQLRAAVSASHKIENLRAERLMKKDEAAAREGIIGVMLLVLVTTATLLWGSLSVLRPLKKLRRHMKVVGAGDLEHRARFGRRDEIGELARSFDEMTARLSETTASRDELAGEIAVREEAELNLRERVKEMKCLQEITRILSRPDLKLYQAMGLIVSALPPGFQYPQNTHARIILGDQISSSPDFTESPRRLEASINLEENNSEGKIEVFYESPHPDPYREPFLREEKNLLETIAEQTGEYLDHRRAEEELRLERRQLTTLFEAMDEIIYISDPNSYELVYVNRAGRTIGGEDMIGKKCYAALQNRNSPCPFCTNDIIFGPKRGQTHLWEFQNEASGRWFRCADKVIRWIDGRDLRFESAADITEQKEMQERKQHLDKLGALGQLTAGVAHELNNPLMGIINFVQFCLSRTDSSDESRQALLDIERETRRCIAIVQNLLTFSRPEDNKSPRRKTDLAQIIDRSIRLLNYRIIQDGIKIETVIEPDLPLIPVKPGQVQQVIVNLLSNALDANRERGNNIIRIRLYREDNYAILEVEDEGGGIPHAIRDRIFDPFFTTKPTGQGTGLGLATASAIVIKHRGNLTFRCRDGIGTIMKVRIPIEAVNRKPASLTGSATETSDGRD